MKKLVCMMLLLTLFGIARCQEFRCTVSVNYEKLMASTQRFETSDKKIFETMQQAVESFVNNRRWTNLQLEQHEKLECAIGLVLSTRNSATDFAGQLTIQLKRPVFQSTYTTGLFNYIESDFAFSFNESQPLEFDPSTYYGTLSSAIAYYLYIMLGEYFDSFASNAGDPFYEMAQTIAQTASSNEERGWTAKSGSKARYWFVENHTNVAYAPLRQAYYDYHRQGLDLMTKDQTQARQNIIKALLGVQAAYNVKHNLLSATQFMDVKIQEIVSIFTPAPMEEKKQVYAIVRTVTPINVSKLKDWDIK